MDQVEKLRLDAETKCLERDALELLGVSGADALRMQEVGGDDVVFIIVSLAGCTEYMKDRRTTGLAVEKMAEDRLDVAWYEVYNSFCTRETMVVVDAQV